MTDRLISGLSRPLQPMPDCVRDALEEKGLMEDYRSRPAYQRNDYLSWINRAKSESTKERRLAQMLKELRVGGIYLNMAHPPSRKSP